MVVGGTKAGGAKESNAMSKQQWSGSVVCILVSFLPLPFILFLKTGKASNLMVYLIYGLLIVSKLMVYICR